jgi:hypothetical protein
MINIDGVFGRADADEKPENAMKSVVWMIVARIDIYGWGLR